MRARIVPLTIAGVLTLTGGVALAETSPDDPRVVEAPVDDTTTTTVGEPTTTTTETTVAPPETTTTTTTVVPDEPIIEPEPEPEEDVVVEEGEATAVHPENHGAYVSQAAHDKEGEGRHGAGVSAVARSDAGKPGKGGAPEE